MTLAELNLIADLEGSDPAALELVLDIGGVRYELTTADEQDHHCPGHVLMALTPLNERS